MQVSENYLEARRTHIHQWENRKDMSCKLNLNLNVSEVFLINGFSVADPGFPRGAPTPGGGGQHTIWPICSKNCMKMKKFWLRVADLVGGGGDP